MAPPSLGGMPPPQRAWRPMLEVASRRVAGRDCAGITLRERGAPSSWIKVPADGILENHPTQVKAPVHLRSHRLFARRPPPVRAEGRRLPLASYSCNIRASFY